MPVFSDGMLLRKMKQEPPALIGVTHNYASSATSLTLTPHADTQAGDFLIAIVLNVLNYAGTPETGWSRLINYTTSSPGYALYTKVAGASEPSNSFGNSGGANGMRGSMITLRNVSRLNLGAITTPASSTVNSTPGSLTAEGGGIIFQSHGYRTNSSISASPSGMTNVGDAATVGPLHGLYYEGPSVAGSRTGKQLEWNNSSSTHLSIQFEALP